MAKSHVRVSKQSCKQGNRLILRGVWAPRHFFSRFFFNFFLASFSQKTWKNMISLDRKCLNIHSHLDLKSLSFSTESTNVLLPTPWIFLTAAPRVRRPPVDMSHCEEGLRHNSKNTSFFWIWYPLSCTTGRVALLPCVRWYGVG
jgi:hypothetical protein